MTRKKYLALALGAVIAVLAYMAINVAHPSCEECFTPKPPLKEEEDEPAIPTSPVEFEPGTILEPIKAPEPTVEERVRDAFAHAPIMVEVAKCESSLRHYDTDGTVLMNREGSSATGVFQLMASYHAAPARNLGWDIEELEGNIAYADHLYRTQGLYPWKASKHCWSRAMAAKNRVISDA